MQEVPCIPCIGHYGLMTFIMKQCPNQARTLWTKLLLNHFRQWFWNMRKWQVVSIKCFMIKEKITKNVLAHQDKSLKSWILSVCMFVSYHFPQPPSGKSPWFAVHIIHKQAIKLTSLSVPFLPWMWCHSTQIFHTVRAWYLYAISLISGSNKPLTLILSYCLLN